MNGVHDMGGMAGLGDLVPEPEGGSPFHHAWEARVHAITMASPTRANIDAGRHERELIPGPQYLAMSYYEKWFRSLCQLLLKRGFITEEEFVTTRADPAAPKAKPWLHADHVTTVLTRAGSYQRDVLAPPRFKVGDRVRARTMNPSGHTRLPRYARGRLGVIERRHGAHVFPDCNAHDLGEDPRHLYCVRFAARELWGEEAGEEDGVYLDLWEPYLDPA
ncbi:MAG: nitrile hydratase subunit beta [Phenylobacterium sp.]